MGYWEENLRNIATNNDLASLRQFEVKEPDLIDKAMMKQFGGSYDGLLTAKQARIDQLQANEAAPYQAEAGRLNRMAANDSFVGSPEGLADFAERPGFWLGAGDTGSNPYTAQVVQGFGDTNQNVLDAFKVQNQDPMAIARMSQNKDMAGAFDNTTQGVERFAKRTEGETAQQNLRNFASSVSMLTTPSDRTGKMMPFGEASSLIQQAAADYPVTPEALNIATDNLQSQYRDIWGPTETFKVGRTTVTGQKNLLGDFRKDAQSVAPVTNINVNNEGGIKDSDFRAWVKDGKSAALANMKFNKPDQLATLLAISKNPDKADVLAAQLENSMTPDQLTQYNQNLEGYINRHAPDKIVSEYGRRMKRTAAPAKSLDQNTAKFILQSAGGDKDLARKMAKEQGYSF
ncbi:MAG: hypothetical protein PHI31_09825 [Desulfuromonadaceae bacterium]|nr:hypothetical protein [Desulfuromonadaceae bacterium]